MAKKILNNTKNPHRFEVKGKDGVYVDLHWGIEGDMETSEGGVVTGPAHIREVDDAVYKELMAQAAFKALVETHQLMVMA